METRLQIETYLCPLSGQTRQRPKGAGSLRKARQIKRRADDLKKLDKSMTRQKALACANDEWDQAIARMTRPINANARPSRRTANGAFTDLIGEY